MYSIKAGATSLVRNDRKHPDGVTMIPWKNRKPIVWDATCPDTLARSYRHPATVKAGAVADLPEERKTDKYSSLGAGYSFTPVAIETFGAMGKRSLTFVREVGHRVLQCTGEVKARTYLLQCLSVALQRGNGISVMGSVGGRSGLDLFCMYRCVSLFVMCEGFVDVEVVFRVPLQVVCILFELFLTYFPIFLSVDAVL